MLLDFELACTDHRIDFQNCLYNPSHRCLASRHAQHRLALGGSQVKSDSDILWSETRIALLLTKEMGDRSAADLSNASSAHDAQSSRLLGMNQ